MWQILKTEFDYNKSAITIAFIISILVLLVAGLISLNESESADSAFFTTNLLSGVMVVYLFLLIYLGSQYSQEKRDRFHTLLPVSSKQFSLERLIFIVLLQSGFAVMLIVSSVVFSKSFDSTNLFYIISSQAFFFIITASIVIFMDLGHFGTHTYRMIYIGLVFALIGFIIWLALFDYLVLVLKFIFEPYLTPIGVAVYTALAIGLFYLSAGIFMRRKVYLV